MVEEEHGLPGGNEDTTDSNGLDTDESGPNTVTNASAGSFVPLITGGIDGTLSFAFAPLGGNPAVQTVSNGPLTSDGKQVYFDTEGPNLIGYYNANGDSSDYDAATDTKVFTMTLASTGAYTFTLHAPVDQPIGGEDSIAINLNGRVTVTDSGGPGADTNVPLNASITVIDDTPDAVVANTTAAAIVLDESAAAAGRRRHCVGDGELLGQLRGGGFRRRRGRQRVLCAGSERGADRSGLYALDTTDFAVGRRLGPAAIFPAASWPMSTATARPTSSADRPRPGCTSHWPHGNGPLARAHGRTADSRQTPDGWDQRRLYSASWRMRQTAAPMIVGFGWPGYMSHRHRHRALCSATFDTANFAPAAGGWLSDDLLQSASWRT